MSSIAEQLAHIQNLSKADATGDKSAHRELLRAIRELQLIAETPLETLYRVNYQV